MKKILELQAKRSEWQDVQFDANQDILNLDEEISVLKKRILELEQERSSQSTRFVTAINAEVSVLSQLNTAVTEYIRENVPEHVDFDTAQWHSKRYDILTKAEQTYKES